MHVKKEKGLRSCRCVGDLEHWLHELHQVGREGVAEEFLHFNAYRTAQIALDYQRLLHRAPTAQELSTWLNSGLDLLSIQIGIESLPEFYSSGG
ncbi:MAG TPA: hypothetical protein VGZ25_13030 [Gemmataceae bacterium]|nr:hypothetical protein [Gemmataceae bacterium]